MTSRGSHLCLKSKTFRVNSIEIFFQNAIICSATGKFVYASLIVTFRHGREEDEIMGVSFKKDLVVDRVQVYPAGKDESRTKLQVES